MHDSVPKHVVQVFVDMLLTHCDVPEIVVLDAGAEFEFTFALESVELRISIRIAGSDAGWQQGLVEWHGGLLSEIRNKNIYEFHVSGNYQEELALAMCAQSKNATLTR